MGCRGIRMIHWVETPTSFMVFCHQTSPAQSLQALKQRLETESTFFQRLQLDRVGEGPGHGELGGSLAKTKKTLAILQGKMVETENQD